jgi:hypothetical protein
MTAVIRISILGSQYSDSIERTIVIMKYEAYAEQVKPNPKPLCVTKK